MVVFINFFTKTQLNENKNDPRIATAQNKADMSQLLANESYSFGDVNEFCNKILKEFEESQDNDQTIASLRNVCGKNCCHRNVLVTSKLMEMILGSLDENILNYESENVLEIAMLSKTILHSNKYYLEARAMLQKCIHLILINLKTEDEYKFLLNVWNSDFIDGSFPVALVEMYITKVPKCIEDDVHSTVEDILKMKTKLENAWTQSRDVRLVKWCSLSKNIFVMVTSILHQLMLQIMLHTEKFVLCVSIVNSFLVKVKNSCELDASDYVLLYPRYLQSTVSVLQLDPNMLSQYGHELFLTTVTRLIKYSKTEPIKAYSLLLHFPKWILVLNKCLT